MTVCKILPPFLIILAYHPAFDPKVAGYYYNPPEDFSTEVY
jgi:hypothetical protein